MVISLRKSNIEVIFIRKSFFFFLLAKKRKRLYLGIEGFKNNFVILRNLVKQKLKTARPAKNNSFCFRVKIFHEILSNQPLYNVNISEEF